MNRGKTITIRLPDGNPSGVRVCELDHGISKAILIPRNELKKAKEIKRINQPGIYFLFSKKDDETSTFKTYIGEAEDIYHRVKQHDRKEEEYWNYAVCFISAKNNLNKAHVKFLESHSISRAKENGRSELKNSTLPKGSSLTESDQDLSLYFFDEIKILLSTLGYPLLEPVKKIVESSEIFYCEGKDAKATGNLTEEGFLVYEGSIANLEESNSFGGAFKNRRARLKEEKILVQEGNILKFAKDFVFTSPSAASSTVLARRSNGWTEWKNKDGKTLDELKRQAE